MLPALSMSFAPQAVAGVACVAICVIAGMRRVNARRIHLKRLDNLQKAAELLDFHARNLEKFLNDPAAPRLLKRILMQFSETTSDRLAVCELASWMSRQPLDVLKPDEETAEVLSLVQQMRHDQPDLARAFSSAMVCGAFGAILRWPESAAHFDQSGPAMVANGDREVEVAVRAAKIKGQSLFDLNTRSQVAAMA